MTAYSRRRVDAGLILLAVAAALATLLAPGSPVRAALVLAALLLVPGWALVTLVASGPPAAMLGLALGLSLGVDVLVSLGLVWSGSLDSALAAGGLLGAAAVLLIVRDLAYPVQTDGAPVRNGR